jgi:hypothetical protein
MTASAEPVCRKIKIPPWSAAVPILVVTICLDSQRTWNDPTPSEDLVANRRVRTRSVDVGLPERSGLLDLARTYLEVQARLWPELAGETGVRVIGASDGFDSANPQSSLLLPVLGSTKEAFITQLRSKVKRGMDDAFRRGDNIQPPDELSVIDIHSL